MLAESWARVADWWADLFGVAKDSVWPTGVSAAHHALLRDEDGMVVTRRRDGVRISLPNWVSVERADELTSQPRAVLLERKFWVTWPPTAERKAQRRVVHAYTDTQLEPPQGIERIDPTEIADWQDHVSPRKWQASGFAGPVVEVFALRTGPNIAAAANLTTVHGSPLTVGVLTHPAHRGRGYATRVARAATAEAVARDGLARYRAEAEHARSRA